MSEENKVEEVVTEEKNFIQRIVEEDLEKGTYSREICTRFPPEPNGYLHIGSAYAINISHTIAQKYNGKFNLRLDDTNPMKEDMEYVNAIIEDMKWIGFDPKERIYYGSDYYEKIYDYAIKLIKDGKAYVCDLNAEQTREYRGSLTEPGKDSPYRNRSVEENLDLFERMKNGEFQPGEKVLRAKIDMASPNINMRDPVIYRIQNAEHYRRGNDWCIYPMYDYAHPIQDYIEGITHSLCSIEFKDHRPLYEWVLEAIGAVEPPKQREFGRMNISGAITSKRYLRQLVFGNYVDGWDDPRLPTLKGLRRRGFTPESIKTFLGEIGVSKSESTIDIAMLEHFLREDLKTKVNRYMAVLDPLKVVITNYPEGQTELLEISNNAENPELGTRQVTFSREIYVDREDFMEIPEKGFRRLTQGAEVRLNGAYFITCNEVIKDETGNVVELRCTYDPETKSGSGFTGRKVKGTIHWVNAADAVKAEVNLYEALIDNEEMLKDDTKDWSERINPNSWVVMPNAMVEAALKNAPKESRYQFIRLGYFVVDHKYTTEDKLVFNRIVALKDSKKKK